MMPRGRRAFVAARGGTCRPLHQDDADDDDDAADVCLLRQQCPARRVPWSGCRGCPRGACERHAKMSEMTTRKRGAPRAGGRALLDRCPHDDDDDGGDPLSAPFSDNLCALRRST